MSLDHQFLSAAFATVFIFAWLISSQARRRKCAPLPPGPRGLPFVGNWFQLPKRQEWLTYSAWGKKYGEILSLSLFGQPVIVLQSAEAISDLLEKRNRKYSDRPYSPMACTLSGFGRLLLMSPYGSFHRECRKLFAEVMAPLKVVRYHTMIEQKVIQFLTRLSSHPEDFANAIKIHTASTVLLVTYGYTMDTSGNDQLAALAAQVDLDLIAACTPGRYLVDRFPALVHIPEWFPGTGFKAIARSWRGRLDKLANETYERVKTEMRDGVAIQGSFVENILRKYPDPSPEQEEQYAYTAASMYAAGFGTTCSSIESFFLAMTLYPDAQRKAQAELLSVIGPNALPTFADRARLPYINALVKELFRWNPVTAMPIPHRLIEEDVYQGYTLPAGSLVVPNIWAMLQDPGRYPDPTLFNPERYIDSNGEYINVSTSDLNPDPFKWVFGFGRRVCPGQQLAHDSIFMAAAMILTAFDISKNSGDEPKVEYLGMSGIICHPRPFSCRIMPRSKELFN